MDDIEGVFASLADLAPAERLVAGRDIADRLARVVDLVEAGELDASGIEVARMQGAIVALRAISAP